MKNLTIILTLLMITAGIAVQPVSGQGPVNPAGAGTGILGFGFGPGIPYFGGSGFGPAILVHYDQSIWQAGPGSVSLGGQMGVSFFSTDFSHKGIPYTNRWTNFGIVFRSAYHYGWKVPGLDTYAGFGAGTLVNTYRNNEFGTSINDSQVGFLPTCFIGGTYFFNKVIGMNAEFGYNFAIASIGLDFRFPR